MLKLLYIPTGNVFTLPDEEALKIKASDRGNYKILDAGYTEEKEEVLEEKTVRELIMPDKEEDEEKQEQPRITLAELEKMDRFALYGLTQKLQLNAKSNANKKTLLKMLKETGIFE